LLFYSRHGHGVPLSRGAQNATFPSRCAAAPLPRGGVPVGVVGRSSDPPDLARLSSSRRARSSRARSSSSRKRRRGSFDIGHQVGVQPAASACSGPVVLSLSPSRARPPCPDPAPAYRSAVPVAATSICGSFPPRSLPPHAASAGDTSG
jgi:hypothetical protein